ncbi:Hypothetical predicted protein [Mytilus galloprovincialis]|uniref:Uncharacterized protein n=1 Tax=Mytilus galloprovincialis TaxID=29158 RepID=A0A8B6H5X6_MYTGA|nr:Hypothetical predicted protein [Mytilus galloprovincialis]
MNLETCLKEEKCVICQNSISHEDTVVVLGEKGSQSVNKASKSRQDNVVTSAGQKLHQNCRKSYTNPKYIALANKDIKHETTNVPTLRSKVEFDFKKHCLFCGQLADAVIGRKEEKQREDEWALEVRGRLAFVQDLHAADALYHQTCSVNFRTLKQTPLAFSPPAKKAKTQAGRKSSLSESFLFAAKYLQQNEDEQITVADLVKKMSEHCGIDDAYGVQHMKNKLQEHFGDKVIISEINGKPNVVTFRNTVRSILQEFYEQTNTNPSIDEEKKSIIQAAAKILKSEILSSETSNKALYPSPDELSAQNNMKYVPESLQTLLQTIFSGKDTRLKIMSIGQSIVQAAAPRMFMLPLQLALGVQLHHNFSSRFLIDTLNSLGFCSSYTEIQKFECCAAAEKGNDIPNFVAESFLQYVADNVDHNSGTLDGNNTFHGMGIMAAVTPGSFGTKPIPRIDVTSEQIALLAKINISYYKPSESNQMASCVYSNLRKMNYKDVDCSYMVNLLWKGVMAFAFSYARLVWIYANGSGRNISW